MINEISFSEAYDIILHMDKDLVKKIPKKLINFIEQNKKCNYITNIDYTKSINEQELQKGTRIILSIIYRDYLCSDEKKKELIQNDEEELKRINKELREKYNPENLFKKKDKVVEQKHEEIRMIEHKEKNFIQKSISKIINIFKRKKWRKIREKLKIP